VPATKPRAALTLALGYGEQTLWASTRLAGCIPRFV